MTIINVYASTSILASTDIAESDTFFDQLHTTYKSLSAKSTMVIMGGDFNAKVGTKLHEEESFIGSHGKGTRNRNGNLTASFLEEHGLYLSNTHFKHEMRHRSTWHGKSHGKIIHNQIDYIVVRRSSRRILKDAWSYHGHTFSSDHSIVITTINLERLYTASRGAERDKTKARKLDISLLNEDMAVRDKYTTTVHQALQTAEYSDNVTPNEAYTQIAEILKKAASNTIPEKQEPTHGHIIYLQDERLAQLSREQQLYRQKMYQDKNVSMQKFQEYQKERTQCKMQIRKRIKLLQNERVERIAEELERNKNNRKVFEAQKLLRKKDYKPFAIQEECGDICVNIKRTLELVSEYYIGFYNQEGIDRVTPFEGPARPLERPVTDEQVEAAVKMLNCRKAAGKDGISTELIKYGGKELCNVLTDLFNLLFEKHQPVDAILEGLLIPLNKPGKTPIASNTRPITLLNTVRKVLSLVLLDRIRGVIEEYVCAGQSGFRGGRSTADVIWTYRWMMATTEKYMKAFFIMGIDMSKAFDCINRKKLLEVLKPLINTSDYGILKYLLSDTSLQTRVAQQLGDNFYTTIGTPQADSLSPMLFIVYLEAAMSEFRAELKTIIEQNRNILPEHVVAFSLETMYADDTDFISSTKGALDEIKRIIPGVFQRWNLKVNADKTEFIDIIPGTLNTLKSKKLGSKLSDGEDIKHRISQARAAFSKMWKIWLYNKKIKLDTRIKLYNACVKSILTYNMGASGASEAKLEAMNWAHRRHLRQIMKIHFPQKITNEELYKACKTGKVSTNIHQQRLELFGHILRQPENIPANIVMKKKLR